MAVSAARRAADPRVVLRVGDDDALGVLAQVPDVGNLPSGDPAAIVRIDGRVRLLAVHHSEREGDFADVEPIADPRPTPRIEALARELRAVLGVIAELRNSRRLPELLRAAPAPGALADGVAAWADLDDVARAGVLAAVDVGERVQLVLDWARNHVAELQVAQSIRNDVTEGVDRQQREFLLRQQLEAIRKELGEGDGDVAGEYRTKLAALTLPEAAYTFIAKEIDRLERTSSQSPEYGWIRTWLDRVFELPWGRRSDDVFDLAAARAVLDADHYGLTDVKDRIVEYMAVRKLHHDRAASDDERCTARVRADRFGPRPQRRRADDRRRERQRAAGRRAPASQAAAAPSSRSSGRPGWARPASASRWPGRWDVGSCASPSAACATRPRSVAIAAPTSGRSRGASPGR